MSVAFPDPKASSSIKIEVKQEVKTEIKSEETSPNPTTTMRVHPATGLPTKEEEYDSSATVSFFFLLRPLTVLMKQTRQVVRAAKQSILLRCLWWKILINVGLA